MTTQLLVTIVATIVIVGLIAYGIKLMAEPWDEMEAVEREMAAEERRRENL